MKPTSRPSTVVVARWCAGLGGVTMDNVIGPETDVFRIGNKMFALLNSDTPTSITLKSPPAIAEALRVQYSCVKPGYYMNKTHWITIDLNGDIKSSAIRGLIEDSYDLVLAALPKKQRVALAPTVS